MRGAEINDLFLRMRNSSGVSYYEQLAAPFSKTLSVENGTLIEGVNFNRIGLSAESDQVQSREINLEEASQTGLLLLQKILEAKDLPDGERIELPFQMMVPSPHGMVGDISYSLNDLEKSKLLYSENPSSYLAATYLELALIFQEKGSLGKVSELLTNASRTLQLEKIKFEKDAMLRTTLPAEYNFGRPESALLYLQAKIVLDNSNFEEAGRIANLLISNNPSDPYAWQALIEFGHLKNFQTDLIDQILEAYPIVLGCRQEGLNSLSRDEFVEHFYSWINLREKKNIRNSSTPDKQGINRDPFEHRQKKISEGHSLSISTKSEKKSLNKNSHIPWIIAGVLLTGILALLFKVFKGESTS